MLPQSGAQPAASCEGDDGPFAQFLQADGLALAQRMAEGNAENKGLAAD
jgi:hypothetical protein